MREILLFQQTKAVASTAFPDRRLRGFLVAAVAACVGFSGALPHLFFAFDTGGCTFFESAWDESFYALVMNGRIANWNAYPARILERWLLSLSGGPNFSSALLSDVIWPTLATLAAGYLASRIVRGWVLIVPLTLALVFASDIFAINSYVIYPATATISSHLRALPLDQRKLFSDPFASFLYVYRTPEPQLSLVFFFCYFAIIIRTLGRTVLKKSDWILLGSAGLICSLIYPFFAAATLMLGGVAAVSLMLTRRWAAGVGCLGITAAAALCFVFLMVLSHTGEAEATRFASRLPLLAPSILYGLVLLPLSACVLRKKVLGDRWLYFALGCCLIPFVTLDQQVITGSMVQTLNWERYVNYVCVVVAASIVLGRVDWREFTPRRSRAPLALCQRLYATRAPIGGLGVLLMLGVVLLSLYRFQLANYRQYAYYNLITTAYAKAIDGFYAENPNSSRRVALEDPSYDAPVRVRLETEGIWFGAYADLVTSLKEPPQAIAAEPSSLHRDWGFEHAARLGLSKDQLAARLNGEIDAGVCWPEMMFYFPFLECAPYVSDFRMYQPARLKDAVPAVSEAYQAYLATKQEHRGKLGNALMLSVTPFPEREVSSLWTQKLVGTTRMVTRVDGFAPRLEAVVYAYWQSAIR
jgi:hypothetical protein